MSDDVVAPTPRSTRDVLVDVPGVVTPAMAGAGEEASASEPPQPCAGGERSEPPLMS